MKTPEELAEEYTKDWWGNLPEAEGMRKSARENFCAGFEAGQRQLLDYANYVSSTGEMTILNPNPDHTHNYSRKGVVVMLVDLENFVRDGDDEI